MKNSLSKNYIYNSILILLNLIYPLITFPYVSRVVGAKGIGSVTFVSSITSYLILVCSCGLANYGVKQIALYYDDYNARSKCFTEMFIINFTASIIGSISYYVTVLAIPMDPTARRIFLIMGFMIVLNSVSIDWLYRGIENYKFITLRNIVFKIVAILLTFVLIKGPYSVDMYALLSVFSFGAVNIVNLFFIKNYVKLDFTSLNLKKYFKPLFSLSLSELLINIFTNLNVVFIGMLAGTVYVGYFVAANKIPWVVISVISSLSVVLLPRISYYLRAGDIIGFRRLMQYSFHYILLLSLPACAGLYILAPQIVYLFSGATYASAILTMRIYIFLIPMECLTEILGVQLLIPLGKEKRYLLSVAVGAIVNITFNILLIPHFMQNGAAISCLITEFSIICIQISGVSQYVKGVIKFSNIIPYFLSTIVLILVSYIITTLITNDLLSIILTIIVSGSVYCVVNYILKSLLVVEMVNKLKKFVNPSIVDWKREHK